MSAERSLVRTRRALGAAAAVFLAAVPLLLAWAPSADAGGTVGTPRAAATTVSGTGPFSTLKVTVAQTSDLVSQTTLVSWTGGNPSIMGGGSLFLANYLQLMQCWSEPGKHPTREQCQYGGFVVVPNAGSFSASRQVTMPMTDPLETVYTRPAGSLDLRYVDFQSVDGTVTTGQRSQFFDASSTNEIPAARVRPDGSGEQYFEMQTGLEAPGLGCGQVINGRAPECWLVVVPRGDTEVDGTAVGRGQNDPLISSPLTQSAWQNHIDIPLQFQPIGVSCTLGRDETQTYGSELINEAMTRWQPALCQGGPRNFSFDGVSDAQARGQLASDDPRLIFTSTKAGAAVGAVYAPVAVSGITISVNIERQYPFKGPDGRPATDPTKVPKDILDAVGRRYETVNLTPRLVAKVLTQSYPYDRAFGTSTNIGGNPFDLSRDPDFLALNPDFAPSGYDMRFPNSLGRVYVTAGISDNAEQVWRYATSDKEGRDFLAGKPDPWGMVLNERYRGLFLPSSTFPRSDLGCTIPITAPPGFSLPLCTLDTFPYAQSLQNAARAISRGDMGRRDTPTIGLGNVPSYSLAPLQLPGARSMVGLSDSASAARYSLVNASLRNASGKFVSPTTEALAAAVGVTTSTVSGLPQPDALSKTASAYPLTVITYAATVPAKLTPVERLDYARLLRFAVGDGQTPGTGVGDLPEGYLPLPQVLRDTALKAVAAIEALPSAAPSLTPPPTPTGTTSDTPQPGPSSTAGAVLPSASGPGPTLSSSAAPTTTPNSTPAAFAVRTPLDPAAPGRLAAVAALVLGGVALLVRAALPWVVGRVA